MPSDNIPQSAQLVLDHTSSEPYTTLQLRVLDSAMYSLSLDWIIELWNPAAERIYGWRADDVIGKHVDEVFRAGEGKSAETEQPQFFELGHWTGELNQRRRDGSTVRVLSSAMLFKGLDGKPHSIVFVNKDLSKQKQDDVVFYQSEERYRAIYRESPCMFFTVDANGTVLSVNEFGAAQLGYTVDELMGKSVLMIFHEEDKPAVVDYVAVCLNNPLQVFRSEFRKLRRDGTVMWVESLERTVINADGTPNVMAVCQDITERKKAEVLLKQAFEKEKELSELKTRFASMASHEFRTPLATILTSTDMIGAYRNKMTDSQIDQKLDIIRMQVDYLRNIVEDVLQYTTLNGGHGSFKLSAIDLDLLCREVVEEFNSQQQMQHKIDYYFIGHHGLVELDKRLMRQIIMNLISNAIKYSPYTKPIFLSLRQTSECLILSISDEGIGIPTADMQRLFEPFHRATNAEAIAGTGLGLAIVKEAVDLHGGTINVESQMGLGTTFVIRIPVNRPPIDTNPDLEV